MKPGPTLPLIYVPSPNSIFFFFWGRVSLCGLELTVVIQTGLQFTEWICLRFLSTGIKGAYQHTQLLCLFFFFFYFFKVLFILLYVYECFVCMYTCAACVCLMSSEFRKRYWIPWTWSQEIVGYKVPCWCWGLNPVPLGVQSTLNCWTLSSGMMPVTSSGWPWSHSVPQTGPELVILLRQPSKYLGLYVQLLILLSAVCYWTANSNQMLWSNSQFVLLTALWVRSLDAALLEGGSVVCAGWLRQLQSSVDCLGPGDPRWLSHIPTISTDWKGWAPPLIPLRLVTPATVSIPVGSTHGELPRAPQLH